MADMDHITLRGANGACLVLEHCDQHLLQIWAGDEDGPSLDLSAGQVAVLAQQLLPGEHHAELVKVGNRRVHIVFAETGQSLGFRMQAGDKALSDLLPAAEVGRLREYLTRRLADAELVLRHDYLTGQRAKLDGAA